MRRALVALVLAGGLLGAAPRPAAACSCAGSPDEDRLARADIAVVGRLDSGPPFSFGEETRTLHVERVAKGAGVPQRLRVEASEPGGGTCGVDNERHGFLLHRGRDGWVTNSCSLMEPERLLAMAGPDASDPIELRAAWEPARSRVWTALIAVGLAALGSLAFVAGRAFERRRLFAVPRPTASPPHHPAPDGDAPGAAR